jgi:16S rRNA (adenine1518-N6/adenine1519-N6)-dimethyltransferase
LPKKSLGQHFLSDPRLLARIAGTLPAKPGDRVLEIGPGRGGLTAVLVERGFEVVAIERDAALLPDLTGRFPTVRFIPGDALTVDWRAALAVGPSDSWFVIGNIPYRITTPLIERALTPPPPRSIVFLLQREVALRLTAAPGTPQYGALTVGVGMVASVERLFSVPPGAFFPPPRVASTVVRITPRAGPLPPERLAPFRRLVVGLFGSRRKQLTRALRTVLDLDALEAAGLVEAAGLEPTRRPETLTGAEFARLLAVVVDAGREGPLTL